MTDDETTDDEFLASIYAGDTPEEILAGMMTAYEIILPRGTQMNDGRRIGIDYGGLGELHMITGATISQQQPITIHVNADTYNEVKLKFKQALVEAARKIAHA